MVIMEFDGEEDEEERVVNAQEVYLLMNKEYRISRNSRINWYFSKIISSSPVRCRKDEDEDVPEELQVIAARGPRSLLDSDDRIGYNVTPDTALFFLAKSYRFVYALDMSPSITEVDLQTSTVMFEEIFVNLQKSMKALIKPFILPGGGMRFVPKVYVTVVAHTSVISCKANQVLLQGCLLTEDNFESVMDQLKRDLDVFEKKMAASFGESLDLEYYEADEEKITFGLFDDNHDRPDSPDPTLSVMSPEANFINMLRYGILALQLLPDNSASGIIVITDGVVGTPEHSLFESLMMQLRHSTISCSFIQLGSGFQLQSGLGHVPYPELMEFIAAATMGVYFSSFPDMHLDTECMTPLQQAILTQRFQKLPNLSHSLVRYHSVDMPRTDIPSDDVKSVSSVRTRKHKERNLHIPLSTLISARLREGYFINDISITKGDAQLDVRLVMPWRHGVNFHCLSVSSWPLNHDKYHSHIEISVEGSYDFIRDIASHLKQKPYKNSYRMGLVMTYWQTMQVMSESDELLVHLQSLTTNVMNYKVPESLKQGVPLFYLPPHQTSPQINIQLSTKISAVSRDNPLSQFASFWRPVLNLDINIWQKWMHTHRIGFILEHDRSLIKYLHIPNSSGRYQNATCRQACTALNFFLRDYSTFVLMENHSYVTLLFRDADKPPYSFFVIRVASKPPCVVLRLAFLGNTPGQARNEVICDLKRQLSVLRFLTSSNKDDKSKMSLPRRGSRYDLDPRKHTPPLQRPNKEILCCVLTRKPIEKILIRYDRMPNDFSTTDMPPQLEKSGYLMAQTANKVAFNIYTTLSRYLFHKRWVWSVQHGSSMPVSMQAIGRILSNVTKIRLQEGFNFAHTNSGILNLVLELDMKGSDHEETEDIDDSDIYPCVVQYVVFPPHMTTSKGSISEEDDMDTAEADGELQIITECWVEPQWGVVVNSSPERKYFDGLNYQEVVQTMFPTDLDCISTMITFEHLNLMCQCATVPSPVPMGKTPMPNISEIEGDYLAPMSSEISIQMVPFPFDLMRLLPKCQQVELLFSTYIQEFFDEDSDSRPRSTTLLAEQSHDPQSDMDQSQQAKDTREVHTQRVPAQPPNAALFTLFLNSLKGVHHREIMLTDFECEQLVSLIQQRERNLAEYPLPFSQRQTAHHQNVDPEPAGSKDIEHHSESALSLTTSFSMGSASQSQVGMSTMASQSQTTTSQGHTTSAASAGPTRVTSPIAGDLDTDSVKTAPPTMSNEAAKNLPEKSEQTIPRWRCFVRSLTCTHIMLCFVPASFDDLLMLVGTSDIREGLSKRSSLSSKRSSMGGLSQSFSTDAKSAERTDPSLPQSDDQSIQTKTDQLLKSAGSVESETVKTTDHEDADFEDIVRDQSDMSIQVDPDQEEIPTLTSDWSPETPIDSCPCPDIPKGSLSINLPCYVYNCPLEFLSEQLVNKWTFSQPDDIYEDLTFIAEEVKGQTSEEPLSYRQRRISELELGQREGQMEDVYGKAKELKQHCTMVSETFLRCFVKGLYQSLQNGYYIDCHDIDSAINEICEESLPLEIDISHFLQCSCGHVRQVMETANLERMFRDDWSKTQPKLITKALDDEGGEDPGHSDSMIQIDDEPRSQSKIPLYFAMDVLKSPTICEAAPKLHQLIRTQFEQITHRCFKPVKTNPEFYFFSHSNSKDDQLLLRDDIPETEYMTHDMDSEGMALVQARSDMLEVKHSDLADVKATELADTTPALVESKTSLSLVHKGTLSGDSTMMYGLDVSSRQENEGDEGESVQSNKNSMSTLSALGDDDLDDLDDAELESSRLDCQPLFVHLACSVRAKNCPLRSMPIKNIPVCFNEIEECLCDLESTVDLNTVRVTLDIICLSLPPEIDLSENSHRPCYQRMMSHVSQVSYSSSAHDDGQDLDESVSVMTDGGGLLARSVGTDPLQYLPITHKDAVMACRDQILWLLHDEIVSIMRCIVPVTLETLEMVTNHIKTSDEKPMCSTKHVLLKFVGGVEQSLQMFIEDFERMNLPAFHLNREGSYYYLSMDRAYGYTQAHAKALHNALTHLDYTDITGVSLMAAKMKGTDSKCMGALSQAEWKLFDLDAKCQRAKGHHDKVKGRVEKLPYKAIDGSDEEGREKDVKDPEFEGQKKEIKSLEVTSQCVVAKDSEETFQCVEVKGQEEPVKSEEINFQDKKGENTGDNIDEVQGEGQHHGDEEVTDDDQKDHLELIEHDALSTEKETDTFCAEDIRISVTRPSPVKELPKRDGVLSDLFVSDSTREQSEEPQDKDYSSDKSSGSSIQVLDDKGEAEQVEVIDSKENVTSEALSKILARDYSVESIESEIPRPIDDVLDKLNKIETSSEGQVKSRHASDHSSRHSSGSRGHGVMSPSVKMEGNRGLSPLTVMGMDVERKGIRRAHSSASFEKYKHEKTKLSGKSSNPQTPGQSGWSTPQRRSSGNQTPCRSRHHSGLEISTPMSTIETSSRCSIGDDGYDGDSSDLDEDGAMMSFNETQTFRRPSLPDFWLIMKIEKDRVSVFFHTRDTGEDNPEQIVNYKILYNQMIAEIMGTCRVVNQKMLLDVLYSTRMCDKLLVPEADEEVCWGKDTQLMETRQQAFDNDSEDSDAEGQEKVYFDAARDTDPGHFACECVWKTSLALHPRLKTGPGRGSMSRGIQTLRSTVLNKFSVSNRNNMFVIKENSTGAVFYLRLEESSGELAPISATEGQRAEDEWSASQSSSVLSLNIKRLNDPEDDPNGLTSPRQSGVFEKVSEILDKKPLLTRQKSEDIITLSAHGICPVGPEISKDLKELLQKKLDDAVLKLLTEILARNPMCKLTPEDVKFIQRPNTSSQCSLVYTIPPSALLQQFALNYYLQQNLQQFVHPPKYMDNTQEYVFLDYTQDPAVPMHEDYVFLYNRPQQSGGNGIACLYLSFVDCSGHPVQLISSPKPSLMAYKDHIDPTMFDNLLHTELYQSKNEQQSPSKSPGPMALVQFTVWAQGTIDMQSLSYQLLLAVKHAVADVVTEYRLLTAPICEPPSHYYKGLDTPTYSAPTSPGPGHGAEMKKQISEGGEKTPKDKMSFSIHSLVPDFLHKVKDKDDEGQSNQATWQELEGERRRRQDLRDKIQRYENGEKGTLVPMYYTTLKQWYQFCHQLKVPAVSIQELRLSNRFPVDYILKDMMAAINSISPDIVAKVFKEIKAGDGDTIYMPCALSRSPLGTHERTIESTLDLASLQVRCQQWPCSPCSYVVIGRNTRQWQASIDYVSNDGETAIELPALTNPKTQKSYQKYKPLEPARSSDRPEAGGVTSVDRYDRAFVPRQRLIMITVNDKQLSLYLYNWATELCNNLERQLLRLVQWHNARSQVLLSIFSQKMGLFQHNPLKGISMGDLATAQTQPNPFSQSHGEVDLVKYTCPPSQPASQLRSRPNSGHSAELVMDEVYRDTKPANPMHKSGYATLRDPIHRHGAQLLEHSNFVKKESDKRLGIEKLYVDWQQRIMPNMHIPEDVLDLLKHSSRLIHSIATPVLFSPQWRKKTLGKKDPPKTAAVTPDPKQPRSRHGSGASGKSRRSGSFDGRWRSQSSIDSPDLSARAPVEDSWHQELRDSFLNQYILYMQDLGIHPIKTMLHHKRINRSNNRGNDKKSTSGLKSSHLYMQKTLPGGIILVEIGFSEEYFSINIFAFEVSCLPVAKNVNPQAAVMFTDECERLKDLTHAHSFSYNFHLDTMLKYIHGSHQGRFMKSHYHVTSFLKDFVQKYPTTPNYAQNFIYEDSLVIDDTNSQGQQLFDYMLQHAKIYNMRSIKMAAIQDDADAEEYALVMLMDHPTQDDCHSEILSRINPQEYSLGLIIAHDNVQPGFDAMCLRLRYWVILVNDKLAFPSTKPERKHMQPHVVTYSAEMKSYGCKTRGDPTTSQVSSNTDPTTSQVSSNTDHTTSQVSSNTEHTTSQVSSNTDPTTSQVSSNTDPALPDAQKSIPTEDKSNMTPLATVNYLGFSNNHQVTGYELLMREVYKARECMESMVGRTITHCRRDVLWQRMILGAMAEEEGRRKRHKTGELLELRDPFMTKLSFKEFQEVVSMVNRVHISEIDPQLKPLENMPTQWYQGLGKVLVQKYGESLRSFCSADNIIQHYVVLNPKQLDMLMMLSVDMLGDRSDVCFVYKEQEEQPRSESTSLLALDLFETFINTCSYHMWAGLV